MPGGTRESPGDGGRGGFGTGMRGDPAAPLPFSCVMTVMSASLTDSPGSSAPDSRGSVTQGARCSGVEDSRCSLLDRTTRSLSSDEVITGVMGSAQ